ncbi:unnamed protein product [Cuscuta epithymum]|uniref:Uncharacterized protein n=1 Tax=Cuscuta epithymum TaxID=186058 RepID=A0AAV0EHM7_9ASTE|nr:unnamed protein product [Cuscuta epithymum]
MAAFLEIRPSFLIIMLLFAVGASVWSSEPTVYDILTKYSLPIGLLPDSVTSYTLSDDGSFEVSLKKPCYVQFDYLVYYEKTITGKLSVGSISDLKGIQVKKLFWFNVDAIKVDLPPSGSIYFQVGIINKELDAGQFEIVHTCQDKALAACAASPRKIVQPTVVDDLRMLLTE